MKLLDSVKDVIREELIQGSELYDHYWVGNYMIQWYTSPHVWEFREGKPRIPDIKVLDKLIDGANPKLVEKYFRGGNRYKEVKKDDDFHPRFIVRRVKGNSRPQMVVQIEEYDYHRNILVLQIITFLDIDFKDLIVKNKGPKTVRYILDLVD
jgi:hypothetical protein